MIAGVSITTLLLVLVAGIGAGFVGYAVGASSLISYPALLAFGIPPVLSNTTNTVGVCGTGIGGLLSARKELKGQRARVIIYALIGLVGGIIGGLLLLELGRSVRMCGATADPVQCVNHRYQSSEKSCCARCRRASASSIAARRKGCTDRQQNR